MKYKVGQLVKFEYYHWSINMYGFGLIVELRESNNEYLIELQGELRGRGHNGNGFSKKVYHTNDYWFIRDNNIEYSLHGNKVVR